MATCAACGAAGLEPHLSVAGEIGAEGLIPTTIRFGAALQDIGRCRACGHMQVDPMPDTRLLAHAYEEAASDDYIEEEEGQRATARRALERVEHHLERPGRMLDLGCWVGFMLAEARLRGWQAVGLEPSEFASSHARERLGLDVITGDLLTTPLPYGSFDLATMGDVIEHLTAPSQALARVRGLLAANGLLWLALPDAGSRLARVMGRRWWSVIPTHVQYFTRRSLTVLLERSGFQVLEITTAPKAFTVRYYLERLAGYSQRSARVLVATAEALGMAERLWAPDFRDRMAVIARLR